ncbi:MAG: hypothetical protein IT383_22065 [Deltaproteobacteria bacterium]|nr:hypothetical protein [Deltaproteobacteria bacterium]
MPALRPIDVLLTRKPSEMLADGVITATEVEELARLARDSRGSTHDATPALRVLVEQHGNQFESPAALQRARALVDLPLTPVARPDNELFRYLAPANDNTVRGHQLVLKRAGVMDVDTGLVAYSRGWGQFNAGVLDQAHGSSVPASSMHDLSARARLNALTPPQRLDAAAKAFGVTLPGLDFQGIAKGFFRPEEPDWAGVCYSWSWAALDARLSSLVDVDGPQGQRGLWIGGQFLSRADLGNWLMALAAGVSQGAGDVMWYAPEAEDLLKACLGYLVEGGGGFRADIGNSLAGRTDEVWFQPFVGAKVDVSAIGAGGEQAILDVVRQPRKTGWGGTVPGVDGSSVKLVRIDGRYANEESDDHEGPTAISTLRWNVYAVLDAQGKVLASVMADDPRIASAPGLPERSTAAVPRNLFAPEHSLIDGILEGDPAPEIQGSVWGPALDFFVGHVLARGVPATTRAAFEKEAGSGALTSTQIAALAERYPTVANGYAPAEWAASFGARGLQAAQFGAPEL